MDDPYEENCEELRGELDALYANKCSDGVLVLVAATLGGIPIIG